MRTRCLCAALLKVVVWRDTGAPADFLRKAENEQGHGWQWKRVEAWEAADRTRLRRSSRPIHRPEQHQLRHPSLGLHLPFYPLSFLWSWRICPLVPWDSSLPHLCFLVPLYVGFLGSRCASVVPESLTPSARACRTDVCREVCLFLCPCSFRRAHPLHRPLVGHLLTPIAAILDLVPAMRSGQVS